MNIKLLRWLLKFHIDLETVKHFKLGNKELRRTITHCYSKNCHTWEITRELMTCIADVLIPIMTVSFCINDRLFCTDDRLFSIDNQSFIVAIYFDMYCSLCRDVNYPFRCLYKWHIYIDHFPDANRVYYEQAIWRGIIYSRQRLTLGYLM